MTDQPAGTMFKVYFDKDDRLDMPGLPDCFWNPLCQTMSDRRNTGMWHIGVFCGRLETRRDDVSQSTLWRRWIKSVYALWRYLYCCKFSNRWCWRLAPGWWNRRVAMAVVEVEGVIPTLAMDVEHTVIVLWVEVEVIRSGLLEPVACEYRCYYCKTGAQEDTKLAINTTRATNTELVGIVAWMTSLFKTMACSRKVKPAECGLGPTVAKKTECCRSLLLQLLVPVWHVLLPHGGLESSCLHSGEASMYLCIGFCLEGLWDTSSLMWAGGLWNRQVVGVVLLVVMPSDEWYAWLLLNLCQAAQLEMSEMA